MQTRVLSFVELDSAAGVTRWRLADVRANKGGKGRGLNAKQRREVYEVPLSSIIRVNLFLDF